MKGFAIGVLVGQLSVMVTVLILLRTKGNKGDRWTSTAEHRSPVTSIRRAVGPKKIDGIWTVRDDRKKNPVDPSRPRVRRAVVLERSRRG